MDPSRANILHFPFQYLTPAGACGKPLLVVFNFRLHLPGERQKWAN